MKAAPHNLLHPIMALHLNDAVSTDYLHSKVGVKAVAARPNTAHAYSHLASVTQADDAVHESIEPAQDTFDRSAAIQLHSNILVHVLLELRWVDFWHGG